MAACPSCDAPVTRDARFCPSCGTELGSRCGNCGEPLPDRARFCPSCGAAASPAAAAGGEAERKVISALFADLVGFTATSEHADPEDVSLRLAAYHDAVRDDIERFGGRIEKLIGDGVFAVFGAPTAHEDDPERAVRAALRIQESVGRLNIQRPELALSVRIAVTTGEAIVRLSGDQEGIVGDVVNTASRLEQVAPPGGVVTDERTHSATISSIRYESLPPVEVKGKADPILIWLALEPASRFGVGVEIEAGTPFIGRSHELRLLESTFERAIEESSVQLVTVSGEPGVGKSRLISEFQRIVDDRSELTWWRQGRCLPYGEGITFWALGEIVKAQAGILDTESPVDTSAKLATAIGELVSDPHDRDWLQARIGPLVGGKSPEAAERAELFSAWLHFFEALAAEHPVVLVFEDLHWADDALLDFIDHLAEHAVDSPLLIIANTRPDLFSSHPHWGGGKRNAATIALSPLGSKETEELIAALDPGTFDPDSIGALVERSGGNPLYATEFVRMLQDRGDARIPQELPDTIQALISARLDLLSADEKSLVQAASVIGRVFWAGALAFVSQREPAAVLEILSKLTRKELVRPVRRSSMKDQAEYSFWHGLVQDVSYGQLPREARLASHVAVAQWIEATGGERIDDVSELLVHHYAVAFDLAKVLGVDDPSLAAQYRRFLLLAAERVEDLNPVKARNYYQRLLAEDPLPRERVAALGRLGRLEFERGDLDGGEARIREAVDLAAPLGDLTLQAELLYDLGNAVWYRGDADASDEITRQLLDLAARLESGPIQSRILAGSAAKMFIRGQPQEALPLAEEAVEASRQSGTTDALVRALSARGGSRLQLGDTDGLRDLREALALGLEEGFTVGVNRVYNMLATFLMGLEGPEEAVTLMEEAVALTEERGLESSAAWSRTTLIEALTQTESWARARQLLDDVWTTHQAEESQVSAFALGWRAFFAFHEGDARRALDLSEQYLERARVIQDSQVLLPATAILSLIYVEQQRPEEALEAVTEFEKASETDLVFRSVELPWVAQALAGLGETDRLEALIDSTDPVVPRTDRAIAWSKAILTEARGDLEGAADLYAASAEDWRGIFALHEAYTSVGAGRCLSRLGKTAEAHQHLARARALAQALGAGRVLSLIEEAS